MRHFLLRSTVLTAFLILAAGIARADPRPPASPAAAEWYGWQVLLADGAVVAATLSCVGLGLEDPCWVPASGYLLTGPIVHGLHRGPMRTFASVGFRVMLPIVGAAIGKNAPDCLGSYRENCGLQEMFLGTFAGVAAALAIDAIWAFDDGPAPAASQPPVARAAEFSARPTVVVTAGGAGIGLAGIF